MEKQQDFAHHAQFVPMFHVGVLLPLLINLIWAVYRLMHGLNGDSVVGLILAVALILMALSLRVQALTVQDRVIRLEMRLRLARVLPPDLQTDILTLTPKQLVALRFASDAEMPDLVREVLTGKLPTQKD